MKFSIGLATFTLLILTAVVEATLHDTAAHKRHAAHVNPRDVAHRAGKRCKTRPPGYSSSTYHTKPTLIDPASHSTPTAHSPKPSSPAHEASSVIQVSPGKCNPIGASSTSRGTSVGCRVDLITVVISESHKTKWPQRQYRLDQLWHY